MRKRLEALAAEAGEMMARHRASVITQKEGRANMVTDIDIAVQRFLRERLGRMLPGAAFIGEESENAPLTDRPTWVVDPIDGTTNFIRGLKCSAVSVALLKDRQPVLGAVSDPFLGETFSAERGGGTQMNGAPVCVSRREIGDALVGFGTSPYDVAYHPRTMALAARFLSVSADLRRSGSAALDLAHVACGRLDCFFELHLKPWDIAAGALLVKEAGGIFAMPLLKEADLMSGSAVLASNRECFEYASRILREGETDKQDP